MFDSVVIGSSPQLMLTAIDLVQKGERVLVIEKSSSLGGAWRGTSFSSYDDVEIGPHFVKPYKNVYEQLIKMGVELLPLNRNLIF